MEIISKTLFWVANSLLIPDIIILLALFVRSLLLLGGFYNQYMARRRNDRRISLLIKNLTPENVGELAAAMPDRDNSLFTHYLREMLCDRRTGEWCDYMISRFENNAQKDIATSRLLSKMGPVLGLIGTLIAMSPALVGLSTGDISGMAYNMQVVFATTVVGLVVSVVGIVTLQFKTRWYDKEANNLDYVARILAQNNPKQ